MIAKVGEVYAFQTIALFYIGRVVHCYPSHCVIEDALQVFQTGEFREMFSTGKLVLAERVPDGTMVPLSGTAILPWTTLDGKVKLPFAKGGVYPERRGE